MVVRAFSGGWRNCQAGSAEFRTGYMIAKWIAVKERAEKEKSIAASLAPRSRERERQTFESSSSLFFQFKKKSG